MQCTAVEANQCAASYLPTENEWINSALVCLSAGFSLLP